MVYVRRRIHVRRRMHMRRRIHAVPFYGICEEDTCEEEDAYEEEDTCSDFYMVYVIGH
jgi:hypothetical protein